MLITNIASLTDWKQVLAFPCLTVVKVSVSWNDRCKALDTKIEELSREQTSNNFIKFDIDNATEVAKELSVVAIPTIIIFKEQKEVCRLEGEGGATVDALHVNLKEYVLAGTGTQETASSSSAPQEGQKEEAAAGRTTTSDDKDDQDEKERARKAARFNVGGPLEVRPGVDTDIRPMDFIAPDDKGGKFTLLVDAGRHTVADLYGGLAFRFANDNKNNNNNNTSIATPPPERDFSLITFIKNDDSVFRSIKTLSELNEATNSSRLTVLKASVSWNELVNVTDETTERDSRSTPFVNFIKVDVDAAPEIAKAFSIIAMPTFIFFKNQKVIDRVDGNYPGSVESKIDEHSANNNTGSFIPSPEEEAEYHKKGQRSFGDDGVQFIQLKREDTKTSLSGVNVKSWQTVYVKFNHSAGITNSSQSKKSRPSGLPGF